MSRQTQSRRTVRFRLSKSTELTISAKTNFILPRTLVALCNKSHLRKVLKTSENILLAFLSCAAEGAEILYAAKFHQNLLLTEGLDGIAAREREREAVIQRRIMMQLKRRKLITENKMGTKVIYRLTSRGKTQLLRKQLQELNRDLATDDPYCVIIFDIPEQQKAAREVFRRFLKECGFRKVQRSVWRAHLDALPHLEGFILELGIRKWVRVIHAHKLV